MSDGLRRDLGLSAAVSVVVGSMIGVGIFVGPTEIAPLLATPGLVMLAWILGGLLVFCGALTFAELGAAMPESGGQYAYMRESYGRLAAFFTGWSGYAVGKAASVAALSVAFGPYLLQFLTLVAPDTYAPGSTLTYLGTVLLALTVIIAITLVNLVGVRYAGGVAVFTTTIKLGAILALVLGGITLLASDWTTIANAPLAPSDATTTGIMSAFGLALIPVFFAYDGWANSTQVAEEVRNPGKNVPRSVILGTLAVGLAYTLVNVVYYLALGADGVAEAGAAARTATRLLGGPGGGLITLAILISIIGTINAVTLSGPRIAFAMARDGVFPRRVERLNKAGVPATSIIGQSAISIALVLIPPVGDRTLFGTLLDYIIVDSFIFYALGAAAVFVLRKKKPDLPRPYKVPLYPIVPAIFILGSAAFLVNVLVTRPIEAMAGIGIVLAGTPIYLWQTRKTTRADAAKTPQATTRDAAPPAEPNHAREPDTSPSTRP